MYNFACLMNNAYRDSETPHVHFHFIPRYDGERIILDKKYKDKHFGYNMWKWALSKFKAQKDIFTKEERLQIYEMMKEEFDLEVQIIKKYVKVMFENKSGANNDLEYKIDEVNVAHLWNPSASESKEMGGFNFSTDDKILRWLVRGDTIYDVIIPDDAEVIDIESISAPHGVFRTNKIIITNPRIMTDELAMYYYKVSDLPEKSYFKSLAGCAIRGYKNTCMQIIKDKVNKGNIDVVLSEINDFIEPFKNYFNDNDDTVVFNEVMKQLNKIKGAKQHDNYIFNKTFKNI